MSIPILCIVGVLLLCADAVFIRCSAICLTGIAGNIPEWLSNGEVFLVLLMVVICFVYTYGMLAFAGKRQSQEEAVQESRPQWMPMLRSMAAVLITALYVLFCGVQIFGLFLVK